MDVSLIKFRSIGRCKERSRHQHNEEIIRTLYTRFASKRTLLKCMDENDVDCSERSLLNSKQRNTRLKTPKLLQLIKVHIHWNLSNSCLLRTHTYMKSYLQHNTLGSVNVDQVAVDTTTAHDGLFECVTIQASDIYVCFGNVCQVLK